MRWLPLLLAAALAPAPAIHFSFRPVAFTLDSCESPERKAPETMAGGVAVFDFDNDGHLDLFFVNGADIRSLKKSSPKYFNRLFRNDGRANFSDVTDSSGLAGHGYDTGVAIGDYDNDGYKDVFVGGVYRNTLYHNNGNGSFTDVSSKAGLNQPDKEFGPLWSVGGAWADVNNDGLLDLFIVNYLSWDVNKEPPCSYAGTPEYCHPKFYRETPNQLLLNKGDGTFADVSASSGLRAHPGKGMGVGVADYDADGLVDFFVPNDKFFNSLFRNKGNARFEEVALQAGVGLAEHGNLISGMGTDFRDVDNDGRPDIALVALDNETFPLYRNLGQGRFKDVTTASGMTALSSPMAGYSPTLCDFDNDGWKDLFVTRGHVQSPAMKEQRAIEQHNTVFLNLGNGRWAALTADAGLAEQPARRHRGSAVADLNHDGKLDVVVTALSAPAEIWLNDSATANHWIEFSLQGSLSNRDGAGARVRVTTSAGTQFNHATSAGGYASSSAAPVHFGLGAESTVREVEIRWPSGKVQVLRDLAANRVVTVREDK